MGKVLFIDYFYNRGHVNFNQIHINALIEQGYDVKVVIHKSLARQLTFPTTQYALLLPEWIRKREGRHPILNRILLLITLLYIQLRISTNKYQHVIISYLDEVSLGLIPLCKDKHIICHHNANNFTNKTKNQFLKRIARHNSFLVFNDYIKEAFLEHGINNVSVISHGCISPYAPALQKVNIEINLNAYDFIVFHPSAKPEERMIHEFTSSTVLADYLFRNKILLLFRTSNPQHSNSDHIVFVKQYLSTEEYIALMQKADVILMAYPEKFKYQVSGVSFECIANHKKILIQEHPALSYCKQYYNYDIFFNSTEEFIKKLDFLRTHSEAQCIASPKALQPNYTNILKER